MITRSRRPLGAATALATALLLVALAGCGAAGSADGAAAGPAPGAPPPAADGAGTGLPDPAAGTGEAGADPAEPLGGVEVTEVPVTVRGGAVTSGTQRVQVALGSTVRLVVDGDEPDELHVHGYDVTADVVPGEPAVVAFLADIPGVFEVELHDSGAALPSLQVG